jgi:peroxiredoxin
LQRLSGAIVTEIVKLSRETSVSALERPAGASRTVVMAVVLALVASVTLNVMLAHRVRSSLDAQSAKFHPLRIGAAVPSIAAKRLGGKQEVISYQSANQPTVLYIFTPRCSWCARNVDNFKALVNQEGDHFRFIGLSLSDEGLADYVAKNDLKLPIYSGMSAESREAYKFSGTPQTVVISAQGRVLQNWMGAYAADQKSKIEGFFHISLPGISAKPRSAPIVSNPR